MEPKKTKKRGYRPFYTRVTAFIITLVLAVLTIFSAVNMMTVRDIYHNEYGWRATYLNEALTAQISGDKIEEYAITHKRDEKYYDMLSIMRATKEIFDIQFIYLLVENEYGDYTYIFDIGDENETYGDSSFAMRVAKEEFPGSDEVLKSGKAFVEARFFKDDDLWGGMPLCYVYSPVLNSEGEVVGFLGSDIDASPMFKKISTMRLQTIVLAVSFLVIVVFFVIVYIQFGVTDPMKRLSLNISSFAEGDLDLETDTRLLKRNDEYGEIYRMFREVATVITNVLGDMNTLTFEVASGRLNSYIKDEQGIYKGSYAELVANSNRMIDINRRILDMMPDAMVFYGENGSVVYRNHPSQWSYEGYTENSEGRTRGKNSVEILQYNQNEIDSMYLAFVASKKQSASKSIVLQDENEDKFYYDTFMVQTAENISAASVCMVFTDVTEYVAMSEKANEANKAKSDFLSRMSHEIRTPMNAIMGAAQIAKKSCTTPEIVGHLNMIIHSSEHLLLLIEDILDLSKIESGKMKLSMRPTNPRIVLERIVDILKRGAKAKKINFEINNSSVPEDLWVICDDLRVRQVVINLMSNAVKFSEEGSKIIVNLWQEEAPEGKVKICFSVRDFGIGIDDDRKEKIFYAFEQADSEISRNYGGTGLGLPISSYFVKMMGSQEGIKVESELGKGSTFSFELLLDKAEYVESLNEDDHTLEEMEKGIAGRRALVVDDVEINREIVRMLLADCDVEMDFAEDGQEAVDKFERSPLGYYDMVLMDVQMKNMGGYEATEMIRGSEREDGSKVKIIGMSANAFQSDVDEALKVGMNEYLTKPLEYKKMITVIYHCINGKE